MPSILKPLSHKESHNKTLDLSAYQMKFTTLSAQLKTIINVLDGKNKNNPERYAKARKLATELNKLLMVESNVFFANPSKDTFASFKTNCLSCIEAAANEFKKHRGIWYQLNPILRSILGVLAALTLLPALIVGLTSKRGYAGTFFHTTKTQSQEQFDAFLAKKNTLEQNVKQEIEQLMLLKKNTSKTYKTTPPMPNHACFRLASEEENRRGILYVVESYIKISDTELQKWGFTKEQCLRRDSGINEVVEIFKEGVKSQASESTKSNPKVHKQSLQMPVRYGSYFRHHTSEEDEIFFHEGLWKRYSYLYSSFYLKLSNDLSRRRGPPQTLDDIYDSGLSTYFSEHDANSLLKIFKEGILKALESRNYEGVTKAVKQFREEHSRFDLRQPIKIPKGMWIFLKEIESRVEREVAQKLQLR